MSTRCSLDRDSGRPLLSPAGGGWQTVADADFVLHVDAGAVPQSSFAASCVEGLSAVPKWLHCRWLYDDIGSELYERITEQPEYYLTRTEDSILSAHAGELRDMVGDAALVELGSGSSSKTRHLLDAWTALGGTPYVPIDISRDALTAACSDLARDYDDVIVEGVAASFRRGLHLVSPLSPVMLMFLGSTVGNLSDPELDDFLGRVSSSLAAGDHFLLGIDLVKDPDVLEAAYNDAAGWTARFTENLFARMNRELAAGIPLDAVEHHAVYNEALARIEIFGVFTRDATIRIPSANASFPVASGERIMIEISRKFRVEEMAAVVERFGMALRRAFADPGERFAVLLFERRA